MLNYHELTVDESRDSPARRKQFVVICSVIIFFTVYAILTSGLLLPLDVQVASFPGGEFVYKTTGRDYAASMSLLRTVAEDLKIKEKDYEDIMYNLYLDDPLKVSGRKQRFASGILLKDKEEESNNQERKRILMAKNNQKTDLTPQEIVELPAVELWERLRYHTQDLPKVKAVVLQFPFTNGFVSALVHSYKVFPALRKYAKERGASGTPVVLTTCSIKESTCTHFVPLTNAEEFFLGMPNADDYLATIGNVSVVNWDGVQKMIWNIVTLGKGSDNPAADFKKGKEQTTKVVDESIPSKEEKPATTAKEETTAQPVDDEQVTHDTKDEL